MLRAVIAGALIGHGGLGLVYDNQRLIGQYESIGLTRLVDDPRTLNVVIGTFEIILGCVAFLLPVTPLLVFVCAWKFCTEMLFVTSDAYGAPFEVIERGGAYAAPLALILLKAVLTRSDPSAAVAAEHQRDAAERPATAPEAT